MRAWLVMVLGLICGMAGMSWADTTWVAPGNVSGEWTRDGSPYVVQGNIGVPPDGSLMIGPGVRVYFDGPYWLGIDDGTVFHATGEVGDSIFFTTDAARNPDQWRGIFAQHAADTLRFEFCVIENSGAEDSLPDATLYFRQSDVLIESSTIRGNRGAFEGAMRLEDDQFVIRRCVFEHNYSAANGGAGVPVGSSGVIEDCVFRANSATGAGGALNLWSDHDYGITLRRCAFENNHAGGMGGAIWNENSDVTYESCGFIGNEARQAGAIEFDGRSARLENCWFERNRADGDGGALYFSWSTVNLRHCVFVANSANDAGAVYGNGVGNVADTIANCTFVSNRAPTHGAHVFANQQRQAILNCVFAFGGPADAVADPPISGWRIRHNTFFGNAGGDFYNLIPDTSGSLGVVMQINANGDSCDAFYNLYLDPLFVDTSAGDFHLQAESPLIDAGAPDSPRDPDSTIADIGAFYFAHSNVTREPGGASEDFRLAQNYPNPFNASTTIEFELPRAQQVRLTLFDLLGREVAVLADGRRIAGRHTVDLKTANIPSGCYFYQLRGATFSDTKRLVLIR
jgi:hypothetical protein